MCRSMADIRSTAAEIRRGKKKKKKEEERNYRMKILWSALLHRATITNHSMKIYMVCPIIHRATINKWSYTRRPASADRTARRQFQATGQPVSRTQASDATTSRCRTMRRSVCNAGASNTGRSLCVQISRERSYPLPIY